MKIEPLITIAIPVYNNPLLFKECLKSIQNQTFKRFKVIIVDDQSVENYIEIIKLFPELIIDYQKNERNLGAVPNMMFCLQRKYDTKYFMVFHEDDILHPDFLEKSINILEMNRKLSFSCCNMSFFNYYKEINYENFAVQNAFKTIGARELIMEILKGNSISWSSVIYRSDIKRINFNYAKYSMLGDRPLLIELLGQDKCAYSKNELVIAFGHQGSDSRWKTLKWWHIINLYRFYFLFYDNCASNIFEEIKKLTTIQMYANYKLLNKRNIFIFFKLIISALYFNLITLKYLFLQNRNIRYFIENLKNENSLRKL